MSGKHAFSVPQPPCRPAVSHVTKQVSDIWWLSWVGHCKPLSWILFLFGVKHMRSLQILPPAPSQLVHHFTQPHCLSILRVLPLPVLTSYVLAPIWYVHSWSSFSKPRCHKLSTSRGAAPIPCHACVMQGTKESRLDFCAQLLFFGPLFSHFSPVISHLTAV